MMQSHFKRYAKYISTPTLHVKLFPTGKPSMSILSASLEYSFSSSPSSTSLTSTAPWLWEERFVFERMKVVLEPSGACALAALMHAPEAFRGRRVGVTLSGGNVDVARFVALMSGAEVVD